MSARIRVLWLKDGKVGHLAKARGLLRALGGVSDWAAWPVDSVACRIRGAVFDFVRGFLRLFASRCI
jgi:hypothetical protein